MEQQLWFTFLSLAGARESPSPYVIETDKMAK
jgi:hypothetical protein